jgi:hypothetical protein
MLGGELSAVVFTAVVLSGIAFFHSLLYVCYGNAGS